MGETRRPHILTSASLTLTDGHYLLRVRAYWGNLSLRGRLSPTGSVCLLVTSRYST